MLTLHHNKVEAIKLNEVTLKVADNFQMAWKNTNFRISFNFVKKVKLLENQAPCIEYLTL